MKSSVLALPLNMGQITIAREDGRALVSWERNRGASHYPGGLVFGTMLQAEMFRHGRSQGRMNLGSGAVTNVGVLAMANDWNWTLSATPSALNILKLAKNHSTGTGVTAAAATDIKLGTAITGIASPVIVGTQVLVSAANVQKYQSVATLTYDAGGPYAVTEWGLFASATLTATTGTPFTAGSASSGTVTGTPLTASAAQVQGQQGNIFENTGAANPSWGLVQSNSTSVVNVPAWYKVSDGTAGDTPANGNAYVIRPIMWDRKQFSAINVSNGDSIQFTYTLTITAGG